MSTVEIETATKVESVDHLKNVLTVLTEQANVIKALIGTVRTVIKDSDKQSKELEKLRNKRTRVKTERNPDALPSGITKPVAITDELAKFLGVAPGTLVPRNEVTKGVSSYVKKHEISDPANKQRFVLDDRPAAKALRVLLGNPQEDVTYFNLQKYLKHHYISNGDAATEKPKKVKKEAAKEAPAPVVQEPPPVAEPVKKTKKVVVKKKTELSEEA
jgi:chromatin remodeling complex protein RSC6